MKHSKFLGVLAATLCLGLGTLTACDPGTTEESASGSKHVHSAAADAAWEGDDNNHWKPCAAGDKGQVDKAKHDFGEPYDKVNPTCTEAGSQKVKCKVCGKEVTQTVKATGHTYAKGNDGEDIVTWTKEANCTEAGEGTKECTVCHTSTPVTKEALGHTYEQENGADKVTWTKPASCTEAGEGTKECTRCHETEAVTEPALGHDIHLVGEQAEAPAGEALVRMYGCSRCDVTYLGFKATEVTAASHDHLTFTGTGEDAGASFWGRPIGNALALDADGTSVNQQGDECVYDADETGDFFEYVFTLSQEQVNELGKCRLYCDAKPANYLSGDFWGRDQQGEDWTRGYYIDGADEHVEKDATTGETVMIQDNTTASRDVPSTAGVPETLADGTTPKMVAKGKAITDARYILYVDDEVKAFESMTDIPCPVQGSNTNPTRTEYVMPYTFESLKVGQNKISLRMAGGYRSTFYNFTFRSVEESEPETPAHAHDFSTETPVAAKGEGYVAYKTAECAEDHAKAIKVRALDGTMAEGSTNKSGTREGYLKLNSNGNSISYKVDYTGAATTAKLYQVGFMDGWSSNSEKNYASMQSGQTLGPSGANFGVKWNNTEVTISAETLATPFSTMLANATIDAGSSNSKAGPCYIGDVNLVNGDNTFTFTRYASYNLAVSDFMLVIE